MHTTTTKLNKKHADVCCDTESMTCMYIQCLLCKEKSLKHNNNSPKFTWWHQWATKKENYEKDKEERRESVTVTKTVKEKCEGCTQNLLEDFEKEMKEKVCKHIFNIDHQHSKLQALHRSLQGDEAILHIDYADNWQCKYTREVQQVHFGVSHRQTTLHNVVLYTTCKTHSLCTLSPSMKHDPAAIWAEIQPVLHFLRESYPMVQKLYFISDGPTMQYQSKKNFFLMSRIPFQMGFTAVNWNFLEAGHGKGPADGIETTTKRTADLQVARGTDIPTAKASYDALLSLTNVKLFYVEDAEILRVGEFLPDDLQQRGHLFPFPSNSNNHCTTGSVWE